MPVASTSVWSNPARDGATPTASPKPATLNETKTTRLLFWGLVIANSFLPNLSLSAKLVDMKREDSSSPKVIRDEKAARLLVDVAQLKLVLPFMERERSVGEVAKQLGLALDATTYRVKKLVKLDILYETRKQARKGRAVTYYRAASAFFVPVDVLPNQTTEELLGQADVPMREQIARSMTRALYEASPFQNWGVLVGRDSSGNARLGLAPPGADWAFENLLAPGAPALVSSWMPLELEFEDAKALQAELFSLINKYAQKGGSQTYLLGLALSPTDD